MNRALLRGREMKKYEWDKVYTYISNQLSQISNLRNWNSILCNLCNLFSRIPIFLTNSICEHFTVDLMGLVNDSDNDKINKYLKVKSTQVSF